MAIPIGTLALSGFGASPVKFVANDGTPVSAPPSNPDVSTSGCGGIVQLDNYAFVASGILTGGGESTQTWNADFTTRAVQNDGQGGVACAGNYAYIVQGSTDPGTFEYLTTVSKIDRDGTVIDSWEVARDASNLIGDRNGIAVNAGGTIAYTWRQNRKIVYAYDLSGSSDLGSFVSDATLTIQKATGYCLPNGDLLVGWGTAGGGSGTPCVKRYNSSAVLQSTYTLSDTPEALAGAVDGSGNLVSTSFWVAYDSAAAGGITYDEIQTSGGSVLNTWDAPSDGFLYSGPFVVVRAAISSAVAPTTPETIIATSTPCCGAGDSGTTPGSSAGDVTPSLPGWTPSCPGGGAIPTASDPTDDENWDDTSITSADVWFTFHLAKYPASEGTTVYRWAKHPLADPGSFKEGRMISFGTISRAASTIDGDYTVGGFSVVVDDSDGAIRTLLEQGAVTEYFLNREGALSVLSPEGRATGLNERVLSRGWCSNVQTLKGRRVSFEFSDILGSQLSGFNLDKDVTSVLLADIADEDYLDDSLKDQVLPIYAGELSDGGALDINGNNAERGLLPAFAIGVVDITDVSGGPPAPTLATPPVITASSVVGTTGQETRYYGATLETPYGRSLMSNIVSCNGASIRNLSNYNEISGTFDPGVGDVNKVLIWYGPTADAMIGWLDEADYNGSGVFGYDDGAAHFPSPSRDESDPVHVMDAPKTSVNVNDNDWVIMAVCLGKKYEIEKYFGSNLAEQVEPKRVEIDAALHGVQIIGPADAEWPFPNTWIERNGITFTGFLARGLLLQAHLKGEVTFAVDLCGPHDDDGLLINQAFRQLAWILNEHVAKNNGTGYRTGDYWPLEAYANGDTLLNITKFEAAQDLTKTYLGDTLGYIGMIALTERISVRGLIRRFCRTFGCRIGHDHHGRIYPFFVDAASDPTAGRALRERIEIIEIDDPLLAHDEIRNRETYNYHVDPEGNGFRQTGLIAESADSIAAHVPGGVSGSNDRRGVREGEPRDMYYTNDEATATDVVNRELARRSRRPRYVPVTVNLMGLEQEIGSQVLVTHNEGLGASGDILMPAMVLEHETDADSLQVTLLLQDLRTLDAVATDGTYLTADADGSLLVADQDGSLITADA